MNFLEWEHFHKGTKLPNTVPGSPHDGVSMASFKCGNQLVEGDDIHEIKRGAVWTNCIPENIVPDSKRMYNKWKKCSFYDARCSQCHFSVGAVYMDPYDNEDSEKPFPCVKVTYMHQSSRTGDIYNNTVLNVESEDDVREIVGNLTLSDDQEGVSESGVKLNTKNYDSVMGKKSAKNRRKY